MKKADISKTTQIIHAIIITDALGTFTGAPKKIFNQKKYIFHS